MTRYYLHVECLKPVMSSLTISNSRTFSISNNNWILKTIVNQWSKPFYPSVRCVIVILLYIRISICIRKKPSQLPPTLWNIFYASYSTSVKQRGTHRHVVLSQWMNHATTAIVFALISSSFCCKTFTKHRLANLDWQYVINALNLSL